jgi:opacity protein-like surface antigen
MEKFGRATIGCLGVTLLASVAVWAAGENPGASDQGTPVGLEQAVGPGEACSNGRGLYAGVFGGGGVFTADSIVQSATVLNTPPLPVRAAGDGETHAGWLGGLDAGYEWEGWTFGHDRRWAILPAAEFEGYYLGTEQTGLLSNSTPRIFDYRAPMDIGVLSANLLLTLHTPYAIHPYIGGGVGIGIVGNHGATDFQLVPPEPGLNHFNSNPDASSCSFAVTPRAGVRCDLGRSWYLFAEYKFLFVDSTNFTFGSTVYPGHPATTPWTVQYGDMSAHMAVLGVGCRF